MSRPRVVIFNDTHGWHSDQLAQALEDLGLQAVLSDLGQCRIDLTYPSGIFIPELDGELPNAVVVRGIAPGSLEQITLRMDVLHILAELDIPVLNPAQAIEYTVDKARTSLRLHHAGLPTPQTWACESFEQARMITLQVLDQGHALVAKPLFGCQGKGVAMIDSIEALVQYTAVGDAFYLQTYVEPVEAGHWQDWRLFVVDNQVCAAMTRRSDHWITNYAQGARCLATTISDEMTALAVAATQTVKAAYAGVDLIRSNTGEYVVLEVNSVPAWKGLYEATHIQVAQHLAHAVFERLQHTHSMPHAL
jgi:RimK family alpha-L-glutamate ligase